MVKCGVVRCSDMYFGAVMWCSIVFIIDTCIHSLPPPLPQLSTVGYHTRASGIPSDRRELPGSTVSLPLPRMSASSPHTLEEQQSKRQGMVWTHEGSSPDATSTPTEFRHIEKFNILTLAGEGCV